MSPLSDFLLIAGLAGSLAVACRHRYAKPRCPPFRRRRKTPGDEPVCTVIPVTHRHRGRAKPDWVRTVVIRLHAERPGTSTRHLSAAFNRQHAEGGVTVGKTFVNDTLRAHALAARQSRSPRPPLPCRVNAVWGFDLTELRLDPRRPQPIAGLLDHGSRAVLSLEVLRDKSSISLLRVLLTAIERHGRPLAVRTDNEAIFTSHLFQFGLRWLGIRHQRTQLHHPWQNGRIERLFGTIKPALRRLAPASVIDLQQVLHMVGRLYNHHRPHQALDGVTPAAAWQRDVRRGRVAKRRRR